MIDMDLFCSTSISRRNFSSFLGWLSRGMSTLEKYLDTPKDCLQTSRKSDASGVFIAVPFSKDFVQDIVASEVIQRVLQSLFSDFRRVRCELDDTFNLV